MEFFKNNLQDKLVSCARVDPDQVFNYFLHRYFNGDLGTASQTKVSWIKNLHAQVFKVDIEKNTISLSPGTMHINCN